ncbi:Ketose-bisphosphate aldolase, class-II [Niveomyces insectorum RCEF 264]|uniref:Fructose-bisphosphate aldolase n=1 Tax=Niveomyces insectorum RCEF 264 TaxID=1081102 RepID=A0A162MDE9_9HYPO|nr:Ketose-bisphosphate aldolase, class-II [Niveomyces insectorum RCEF 264]
MAPQTRLEGNKTLQILRAAEAGKYGVLAAIAYNLEHILGFVRAAERKRSPLIIQLFPWAITYSQGLLVHAAAQAARQASVPIAVHLDHCQDPAMVKQACDLPFDSIMVDMSHHAKADNIAMTKELVAYCHARGKATEAEPGRIEGGEDGIASTADLSGLLTTPEETQQFVDTGVDFLAPAFGNVHGEYGPRGVILEWDRLESIRKVASAGDVRVVLHGVNRFPDELTRKLIAAGITKINVNRDIFVEYYAHLEANAGKMPFTQLLEEGVEEVATTMARHMDIVLSSGKA